MKLKTIFISFTVFSLIIATLSYTALWRYHIFVTEAALSLCGEIVLETESTEEKSNKVKDLLTFARISDEEKLLFLQAVEQNRPAAVVLAEKMLHFTYSPKKLRELRAEIRVLNDEAMPTFLVSSPETAVENAETLIKKLYGRRVNFRRVEGNGTDYLLRYYCGNICIDACADGSLRYTADIEGADGEDPLLSLLFPKAVTTVKSSREEYGFLQQTLRSNRASAEISLDPHTNRVFAAKILFKS